VRPECDEQIHTAIVVKIDPRDLTRGALHIDAESVGRVNFSVIVVLIELVRCTGSSGESFVEV